MSVQLPLLKSTERLDKLSDWQAFTVSALATIDFGMPYLEGASVMCLHGDMVLGTDQPTLTNIDFPPHSELGHNGAQQLRVRRWGQPSHAHDLTVLITAHEPAFRITELHPVDGRIGCRLLLTTSSPSRFSSTRETLYTVHPGGGLSLTYCEVGRDGRDTIVIQNVGGALQFR